MQLSMGVDFLGMAVGSWLQAHGYAGMAALGPAGRLELQGGSAS
jgi:hypothetical protein